MPSSGFVKVIAPGSQEFGEAQAQLVKMARGKLRGDDLRSFVKRAGHQMADAMRHVKLADGDVPIHLIALGATEYYGPNRNGDAFSEATCKKYHPTFVKHARWYRNHANKNPEKSWGLVKYSHYNEPMKRIELIVALNGTKEAAARNGGLLANEELEKLASGDDIAVSMACRVPFDVCSGCGNKARNREEYFRGTDQGGHCKMGGLRDRITLVDDGGAQLYAENPDPTFFDISRVFRPADRIAWVTGQMKAASGGFISGADLAERWEITAPAHLCLDPLSGPRSERWVKLAGQLAAIERRVEEEGPGYHALAWAPSVQPDLPWGDHGCKQAEAVAALQGARVCPPLRGFLELFGARPDEADRMAKMAAAHLPGIYRRMLDDGTVASADPSVYSGSAGVPPLRARAWAEKRAADYGLAAADVRGRTVRASLQGDDVPAAREAAMTEAAGGAYEVARGYALFKLALLDRLPRDDDFNAACGTAVRQNYV